LDILMLGTGSAFAKKHFNTNALIEANGYTLMIDCGTTAPTSLYHLGKPIQDIDAVLITHIHADHIGGLEEYAFRMKFEIKKKPVLYVPADLLEPLWENALKGGLAQGSWQTIGEFFQVHTLEVGIATELHPGLSIELIPTEHIPNKASYSLLINDSFFYTSDMRFDEELVTRMVREKGCIVFHDCQLQGPGAVHAALEELLTLPEDVQERVRLMHYADNYDEYIGKTGKMAFVEQHVTYTF
jgi:metal-dependent hydrolase (beta-lactamase superfamily II)